MTTVPGTYFTKEQLEVDLKVDNVSVGEYSGSSKLNHFGYVYQHDKKQYDKALAWYLLAAMENNSTSQNNIGTLYRDGVAVPKNYMCAMKWLLKSAEQNEYENTPTNIGDLIEHGHGVPLDKYRALEWFCHGGDKSYRDRLKNQGYHRSSADKKKTLQQLRKEAEAILDAEKKKLEAKQHKTQEEMEALTDVEITYKLVDGGKDAWNDIPALSANDKQRYTKPVSGSVTISESDILELKKQIQELKLKINSLEYQLKEKNDKINSLQNENRIHRTSSLAQTQKLEILNHEKATLEQNKTLANIEIDRLKASNTSLEQLLKSKEDATASLNGENKNLSTANQFIIEMVETQKSLLQAKTNEMELLRQNMEHLLANEQRRNGALEQENRLLMEGRAQDQTNAQNTRHLHSNNNISSTHVETRHDVDNDDGNPQNDINYDTELDNTEESDDDDTEDDINYDTPSEDVEK